LPMDAHLWLSEVRARWYDPVQGRFISEDPLGLSAGINPYVFANNDPINGSDPSGLCPPTEIEAETLDNGDVVPFCPDGSDPVFSSTTPAPPVNVTAAAPPWPFSTSRTTGYDDASDRGGDLTALFRSPGVTPFNGPSTPTASGHPAGLSETDLKTVVNQVAQRTRPLQQFMGCVQSGSEFAIGFTGDVALFKMGRGIISGVKTAQDFNEAYRNGVLLTGGFNIVHGENPILSYVPFVGSLGYGLPAAVRACTPER